MNGFWEVVMGGGWVDVKRMMALWVIYVGRVIELGSFWNDCLIVILVFRRRVRSGKNFWL